MLSRSSLLASENYAIFICGQSFEETLRPWSHGALAYDEDDIFEPGYTSEWDDVPGTVDQAIYFMPIYAKRLRDYEATKSQWRVNESFFIGLALERVPDQPAVYRRIGLLELNYPGGETPPWWSGSHDLNEDDYLTRHDNGTVEIRVM